MLLRRSLCRLVICLGLVWLTPVVIDAFKQVPVTYTVCAANCDYLNSELQAALDVALPSDTVLTESGHTYTAPDGGYVLGARCMSEARWNCITFRTGVTSTGIVMSLSEFPADGVRIDTSYRGVLSKFVPQFNNQPALRTIYPGETGGPTCATKPCRADGWTVMFQEFAPKADYAQRALVRFGTNSAGRVWNGSCVTWPDATPSCWDNELPDGETQDTLVEIPQYLSFIQNDLHGDSFVGQHQGMVISTKDVRIWSNSFTDIKSMIETQALLGVNGIGPYSIKNNLFEATGENTMFGGDDPYLIARATISGSPTTTVIALSSPVWYSRIDTTTQAANLATDIYSEIYVSITHAGTQYTGMACTLSGSTCTLDPPMPVTPSAGDIVQWDWVHGGITYEYNLVRKPAEWFGNVLSTPTGVTATAVAGGSLTAGTYCYRVMWFAFVSGADPDVQSAPSTEVCAAVNGTTTRSVKVDWPGDSHATRYWVYGRASGAQTTAWEVAAGTVTYTDDGTAGAAETPLTNGHEWKVKNLAEWKNADGRSPMGPNVVRGNIFERSWCCLQSNGISIKVNNQLGDDVSATVRDFTLSDNWFRHMNRWLSLSTSNADTYGAGIMEGVGVVNNLVTDLSSAWVWPPGGDAYNSAIYVAAGDDPHAAGNRGCIGCFFKHNSVFASTNDLEGPFQFGANVNTDKQVDFILRDNIHARDCTNGGCDGDGTNSLKEVYGPGGSEAQGTASWNMATSGSSFADHNAWPDGSVGTYTAGPFTSPFFPTDASLKSTTHLTNYGACHGDSDILGCALVSGSTLHLAASDGADVGANITTIKTYTDIALSGVLQAAAVPDVTIQAEDFNAGGEGVAYHDLDVADNNVGPDIETTSDTGGGEDLGWAFAGEWLKYDTTVPATGSYLFEFRVASDGAGGTFHIEQDGVDVTGAITVPDTGGWQVWTTVQKSAVAMTAGAHTLRLVMDTDGVSTAVGNFNWFAFTQEGPGSRSRIRLRVRGD